MKLKSSTLLDPRGTIKRGEITLAPRPSLEELQKGRILFYDNTNLESCNYNEVFIKIKEELRSLGITNFVDYSGTARGKTTADFREMAKKYAQEGYVAAVTAFANMGTSPAMTVFTIELEKVGIPSVLISSPPGSHLASAVAWLRAGQLCLCPIDVYQASTGEEVRNEIEKKMGYIMDALTAPADRIDQVAKIEVDLDLESSDGIMDLGLTTEVEEEVEPGLFMEEFLDEMDRLHTSDGLPVIPPNKRRFAAMMEYCPFPEDRVLIKETGPSGKDILVSDVIRGAIMAGCQPRYVPIILTAFQAMADKSYNFIQSVTTSHHGGNLILVSGPIAQEIGLYGGQGCLGPGFRANATIGRGVNLVLINTCRGVPGIADLDCLASPSQYSYCFAEEPSLTPWNLIHEERFLEEETIVYVLKAEPPRDVLDLLTDSADELMVSFANSASSLGNNNCYLTGPMVVVLTPDHAQIMAKDGWDKEKIRNYLYQEVRWPREKLEGRGIAPVRPKAYDDLEMIPVTRGPEDIEVVVAGGRGGHSAIILPWAAHSEAVILPVTLPDGKKAKSINDFRCK